MAIHKSDRVSVQVMGTHPVTSIFADHLIKDELVAYSESEFRLASACGLERRLQIGFSHIIDVTRNSHHL